MLEHNKHLLGAWHVTKCIRRLRVCVHSALVGQAVRCGHVVMCAIVVFKVAQYGCAQLPEVSAHEYACIVCSRWFSTMRLT
jgi:hypothetical protein